MRGGGADYNPSSSSGGGGGAIGNSFEMERELLDCRETISIMQIKMEKLEQLLLLKDRKIESMQVQLDGGRKGGGGGGGGGGGSGRGGYR